MIDIFTILPSPIFFCCKMTRFENKKSRVAQMKATTLRLSVKWTCYKRLHHSNPSFAIQSHSYSQREEEIAGSHTLAQCHHPILMPAFLGLEDWKKRNPRAACGPRRPTSQTKQNNTRCINWTISSIKSLSWNTSAPNRDWFVKCNTSEEYPSWRQFLP